MDSKFAAFFREFLIEKGYDVVGDDNFIDTPARVEKVFNELIKTRDEAITNAKNFLNKRFSTDNRKFTGMLSVKGVEVVTMCPHHLLPVRMNVDFAYIPDGYVVGLSKIVRFLKELGRALWLQEEFTELAVDIFTEKMDCQGCMAVVRGVHGCMIYRGVQEEDVITTSAIRGVFEESIVREEALMLLGR